MNSRAKKVLKKKRRRYRARQAKIRLAIAEAATKKNSRRRVKEI